MTVLLFACAPDPAAAPDASAAPELRATEAFRLEGGHWYLQRPENPARATIHVCGPGPLSPQVRIAGELVPGAEGVLRSSLGTKTVRVAEVAEEVGAQRVQAPDGAVEALRAMERAWPMGTDCEADDHSLRCEFYAARERHTKATTRPTDSHVRRLLPGARFWGDACHEQGVNWVDRFLAEGVTLDQLVFALVPRWSGPVPWANGELEPACIMLSGTAAQQEHMGRTLLTLDAETWGAVNEVLAVHYLGVLQRAGRTDTDWTALASPTSSAARQCLAWEHQLVAHRVTRPMDRSLSQVE